MSCKGFLFVVSWSERVFAILVLDLEATVNGMAAGGHCTNYSYCFKTTNNGGNTCDYSRLVVAVAECM